MGNMGHVRLLRTSSGCSSWVAARNLHFLLVRPVTRPPGLALGVDCAVVSGDDDVSHVDSVDEAAVARPVIVRKRSERENVVGTHMSRRSVVDRKSDSWNQGLYFRKKCEMHTEGKQARAAKAKEKKRRLLCHSAAAAITRSQHTPGDRGPGRSSALGE